MTEIITRDFAPVYDELQIVPAGAITMNPDPAKQGNEQIDVTNFIEAAHKAAFTVAYFAMVNMAGKRLAGDHIHYRREFQVATLGNPIFIYRNAQGEVLYEPMGRDRHGNLKAFIVPRWLPHAVVNPDDTPATIFELYDIHAIEHPKSEAFRPLTEEESFKPYAAALLQ